MNLITTVLIQISIYMSCIIIPILLLNTMTKGLILKYFQVLGSRGGKLLLLISNPVENYWEVGTIQGADISYHDKESRSKKSEKKRLTIPEDNIIYRLMGVNTITIDDTKNIFLKKDLNGVTGYNSERMENLVINALNKPKNEDDEKRAKLVFLIAILTLAIVGFCAFMIYNLSNDISTLTTTVNTIKSLIPAGAEGVI